MQQIGSFNPLTDDDWTEMAYVGNTARLCQAIIDGDLEHVEDWLAQDGVDPNRRDHTGRTPLHLAVMTSTPAIVKELVYHGARLVARVADGRTALHLAAQRGDAEIVKILMDKSTENEAEEAEKEDQRRKAKKLLAAKMAEDKSKAEETDDDEDDNVEENDSDGELIDDETSDDGVHSTTTASFVKVKAKDEKTDASMGAALYDNDEEPDFYDVNVVAWDQPCSALHFAIIAGHENVVRLLCQEYGADALLPIKFFNMYNNQPSAAILTMALALSLPLDKAKAMTKTLLDLGATCSQADLHGITVFHRYVESSQVDLVQLLLDLDKTGSPIALKNVSFPAHFTMSPLLAAVSQGDIRMVLKLLENGAAPQIDFDTWLQGAKKSSTISTGLASFDVNTNLFQTYTEQPLIVAMRSSNPNIALELLERGADPDTKASDVYRYLKYTWMSGPENALAFARKYLKSLREYKSEGPRVNKKPTKMAEKPEAFLSTLDKNSWLHVTALADLKRVTHEFAIKTQKYEEELENLHRLGGEEEKRAAIAAMIKTLEAIEARILATTRAEQVTVSEQQTDTNYQNQPIEFTKDYEFEPQFSGANDITDARRLGYVQLFEAAWNGDLDKIRQLTLAAWGDNKSEPPLAIAVSDMQGNTVFSLAFLRGHYKVARATLEIAQAQYAPADKPKVRYEMRDPDDYDGEDTDMDSCCGQENDEDEIMYRTIVDNGQFTIENIGEVNMQVKGTVVGLPVPPKSIFIGTVWFKAINKKYRHRLS